MACSFSLSDIFLFRYLSNINPAIGAAQSPPAPAFSTKTAIAILGLSMGAKAIKTEWFFLFLPFCTVPVFPHTMKLSMRASLPVPPG